MFWQGFLPEWVYFAMLQGGMKLNHHFAVVMYRCWIKEREIVGTKILLSDFFIELVMHRL